MAAQACLTLTRDITAGDLAMDAPYGDGGYAATDVIGPAGSTVLLLAREGTLLEVTEFANDPFAVGFIGIVDVEESPTARKCLRRA